MSEDAHGVEHPDWGTHGPLGVVRCPTCWSHDPAKRIPTKTWLNGHIHMGPCEDAWHGELVLSDDDKKFLKRLNITT